MDGLLALDVIGKTARRYGRKLLYVEVPPLIKHQIDRYHLDLPLTPDSTDTESTDVGGTGGAVSTIAVAGDGDRL